MSASSGSGTTYPYSSADTGCHSRIVISPALPRLEAGHGEVAAANSPRRTCVVGDHLPRGAAIVGAIKLHARLRCDGRYQPRRLAWSDGKVRLHHAIRKAAAQLRPRAAAVVGAE